jgi:hypothetical protein
MRSYAEDNLDDDVADVQSRPDCECAPKSGWRVCLSRSGVIMVIPLLMSSMIVVTHRAILLRLLSISVHSWLFPHQPRG